MKIVFIALITTLCIFADVHFAKLEPIDTVTIKSEVNGRVVLAKEALEGKVASGVIVQIDDKLDKVDLKSAKESLAVTLDMIKLNKNLLPILKRDMIKKRELFNKVSPLASSSKNQKNLLYASYVGAKRAYSSVLEKILTLRNQKVTLNQKIAKLNDIISKKSISVKNRYIYSLNVKRGEYVTIAMPIAIISNINRAKLIIYLSKDELKDISKKSIYINDKKTNLKFSKIWKIADKKYISSYRAEIVLKPIDRFSTLVKVEVK